MTDTGKLMHSSIISQIWKDDSQLSVRCLFNKSKPNTHYLQNFIISFNMSQNFRFLFQQIV
jgi:hypothetical protein